MLSHKLRNHILAGFDLVVTSLPQETASYPQFIELESNYLVIAINT